MRFRTIEPSGPPVTALQLAICTAAIIQAWTGEEIDPTKFIIDPFDYSYQQAILHGDIDGHIEQTLRD